MITPSACQMKKSVRKVIKARAYATYEGQQPGSDSITWHMLAAKGLPFKGTTTRNQQVAIHRLRLGYKCYWEIGVPKELDCPEYNSSTSKPLLQYILESCHLHQLFGPRMDMEVEGTLAEAAKPVNTALRTRCQSLQYFGHHLCHDNQSSILQTYDLYPVPSNSFHV